MTDKALLAGRRGIGWIPTGIYVVVLAVCTLLTLAPLAVGAVVGVAANVPSFAAELTSAVGGGNVWARGVIAAVPRSEPVVQGILDYAFSLLSVVIAVTLLVSRERTWSVRLLVLAMIGSAGAFNLQSHVATATLQMATGLPIGTLHQVLLHGVACAAYVLALLVFPTVPERVRGGLARDTVLVVGLGTLVLAGIGTTYLPHTTTCVLFFGFLVPVAGVLALRGRIQRSSTAQARTQSRLLFSVLVGAFAVTIVLAIITGVLWTVGWTGLTLVDPTAHAGGPGADAPTALLFWFSRLACTAIAGAVLVATLRGGLWTAERLFSRGLVAALVAALIGGGHFLVRILAGYAIDTSTLRGSLLVAAIATVPAALAFLPVYVLAERVVDRLLYGTRPTPYSVLSGIAALSRTTTSDAPDLARVAEAVGRGLGATTCRLTVVRSGLRDRVYTWAESAADPVVEVAVRHGAERIGSIAVDRSAVAGLHGERQHLLEDIADSLGAVFQASRSGIELERQLRAALAYAGGIAVSRRAVVAEMDWERRRIERDLHDGAQHHLVSLRLTLGLVEHQVSTSQFEQARARLEQIADQIEVAESILAETAKGVSAPLLADLGLVEALRRELGGGHPPVAVDSTGIDAGLVIPPDVESAVYFCCLESVNNARKHAPGAAIAVRLSASDNQLRFEVQDQGPGWDTAAVSGSGRGLRNLTARVAAVSGRVEIRSKRGEGTTVEGSAPLPVPVAEVEPDVAAPAQSPPSAGGAGVPLIDQVRDALRSARELYHGSARAAELRELAERLDEPLRVAVAGPAGSGTSTLVSALGSALEGRRRDRGPAPQVTLIDVPGLRSSTPQDLRRARDLLVPEGALVAVADTFVLLMRHGRAEDVALFSVLDDGPVRHRSAQAIGVLARADELPTVAGHTEDALRAAQEWGARIPVRQLCQVVVPVSGMLARAAVMMTDDEYRALVRLSEQPPEANGAEANGAEANGAEANGAGTNGSTPSAVSVPASVPAAAVDSGSRRPSPRPVPMPDAPAPDAPAPATAIPAPSELTERFGASGVGLAIELIRSGRASTPDGLATELMRHSGLARLHELVDSMFARRAAGLKARSALQALEALVRTDPPPDGGEGLRYRLDRIRSGVHELTEIDLVDTLRSGELRLTDTDREEAERLLGAAGTDPRIRLALPADAGVPEVAQAAAQQLEHWQRMATRPLATKDVRDVAATVAHTCEQLLAAAR